MCFPGSRKWNSTAVRLASEVSRQSGNAAAAASMTARASSTLASATCPLTSPVAGFVTGAVPPDDPVKTSLSTQWEITWGAAAHAFLSSTRTLLQS